MIKNWNPFFLIWLTILIVSCSGQRLESSSLSENNELLSNRRFDYEGKGMQPTIGVKAILSVNEVEYIEGVPKRGDIILFRHPKNLDIFLVKRIIGLPNEQVLMSDEMVWIDDKRIQESYLTTSANYSGEWSLGEEEYFVLGDNRNYSSDSHLWGGVPFQNIIGKITAVCDNISPDSCEIFEDQTYDAIPQP